MSKGTLFHEARKAYHLALLEQGVLCISDRGKAKAGLPAQIPSNADKDSNASIVIAQEIYNQIQSEIKIGTKLAGQMSGSRFEQITRSFIETTFAALKHLRPGTWDPAPSKREIWNYEQYHHLAELSELAKKYEELAVHLGHKSDYVIAPDILLVRKPETDEVINSKEPLVDDSVARKSVLRSRFNELPLLHASISCKWTLRSDRAQNARSEALNLIHNRKGRVPHMAVVTGEPLPSRARLAGLGHRRY